MQLSPYEKSLRGVDEKSTGGIFVESASFQLADPSLLQCVFQLVSRIFFLLRVPILPQRTAAPTNSHTAPTANFLLSAL